MKEKEKEIIEGGGVLWRRKSERSKEEREGENDQERDLGSSRSRREP